MSILYSEFLRFYLLSFFVFQYMTVKTCIKLIGNTPMFLNLCKMIKCSYKNHCGICVFTHFHIKETGRMRSQKDCVNYK